jgi:hypothetical protein
MYFSIDPFFHAKCSSHHCLYFAMMVFISFALLLQEWYFAMVFFLFVDHIFIEIHFVQKLVKT